MPLTVHTTPRQEQVIRALVDCGYYGNLAEVGRVAFDNLVKQLTQAQRREIAIHLYTQENVTLSRVAEVLDVPIAEAKRILLEAGVELRTGTTELAEERTRKAKAGATKYRRKAGRSSSWTSRGKPAPRKRST